MAVTFVIGRAGSGKTSRCFRAIVDAMRQDPIGPPIYWLLPKQATFTAERELTCASGLDAFCRARVVSFDEFGRDVFNDCGGSSIPEITPLGRQIILGHLLRQNRAKLRFFSKVARQPGLAAELDATFAELERSGKSATDLALLITELSESNAADLELAPLLDKLHDTRLLYEAYTTYLGQEWLDPHRRMLQVEASLSRCSFLRQSMIYVDGFLDFTDHERRTIVGAAKAGAAVEICIAMDPHSPILANPHTIPDDMSLFRRTEETYRKLYFACSEANVPVNEPVLLDTVHRFATAGLGTLERDLFRDPIQRSADSDGIALVEAPDRRAEVDAVARGIQALLREGYRLRDVGVLVRDLDHYHGLIDASFREHGIPYFVDRRRTAAHHPLLQFVRSVFQIARHDWPHDAVMAMLHTGLAGMSLYEADGLENYVLAHRIRGVEGWEATTPWGFRRRIVGAEDADGAASAEPREAEQLRRPFVDKLRPLVQLLRGEEPLPVRQIAAEIFAAFDRFKLRQTLAQWIADEESASRLEQAAEHEQVWANLVELFDQMVDLLGQERLTPAEFYDVLESSLDRFDLALAPPTVDQVLVGQADRTRTAQFKAAFVLGLNEGEFPRPAGDGSILTDRDRRTLRQRRIDLDPGSQQKLLDERLLGYIAMTRASRRLVVSRHLADDDGRPAEPSTFWRRIVDLFPDVSITLAPSERNPTPAQVATPRQLVTSLMRWVRSDPDPVASIADAAWPALYQWLATGSRTRSAALSPAPGTPGEGWGGGMPEMAPRESNEQTPSLTLPRSTGRGEKWARRAENSEPLGSGGSEHDRIGDVLARAWPALSYTNTAELSADVAGQLFSSPLSATVSQLETFAACPFKHFARYTLGLRDRDHQDVSVGDLSRLYHDLLERALKDVLRKRAAGDRTATLEAAIDHFIQTLGGTLRDELMLGSARNRYLLDRTRRALRQVALAQREVLKRGLFRPQHVGVTFGPEGDLPAFRVATPSGGEALLSGKIDRVDRIESTGDVSVIDYKLGGAKLPLGMVMHGLSLQLLSYLLVVEANGSQLAGKSLDPAAAFYLQLVRRIEDVKHPSEAEEPSDPKWHLKLKPRGLFDRRCLGALDRGLANGASDVVQAFIKQDGSLGRRNTSDVAESQEFRDLLKLVAAKLGELADGILSGRIDVAPYRLNDSSPCPRCEYRSLCRFDPAINKYNHLMPISREEVFARGNGNG
jgi:ATP-dependent helicase/nuclease subunit B